VVNMPYHFIECENNSDEYLTNFVEIALQSELYWWIHQ
jgi:hypothetical protein